MTETVQKTMDALRRNRMTVYYAPTRAEVLPLLKDLLHEGDTVGVGGSITLDECGVLDFLSAGPYHYLNRYAPGLSGAEAEKLHRAVFSADAYLSSANAITEDGALVNMDGRANRVAALAYGPAKVIFVAGQNKIVPDEAAAKLRIETVAAPRNTKRLGRKTPCAVTGRCERCHSPERICCSYLVQRQQLDANRVHVILVGEELGY